MDTYEAALGLSRTRNAVVHGTDEIDQERALGFVALTAELESRIGQIELDDLPTR